MVRIKKEKTAIFKSVLGPSIKLDILIKDSIFKITVINLFYTTLCKRGIILGISAICNFVCFILNTLNVKIVIAIFILILLDVFTLCTIVKEENLIIVRDLGFQVTTKYLIGEKTLFIPQEQVQKIFINEVIFRNKVVYILSLLTKDASIEDKLIPLFSGTLPRLACLRIIYRHLKALQT